MPKFSLKKFFSVMLFLTLLGCLKSFGANAVTESDNGKIEILDGQGNPIAASKAEDNTSTDRSTASDSGPVLTLPTVSDLGQKQEKPEPIRIPPTSAPR